MNFYQYNEGAPLMGRFWAPGGGEFLVEETVWGTGRFLHNYITLKPLKNSLSTMCFKKRSSHFPLSFRGISIRSPDNNPS